MLPMKQITTLTIGWMVEPPQKQASPHPISGVHWCSLVDLFWRRQRLANSRCDPSLKVVFQCISQVVLWVSLFAYPSYPLKVNAMENPLQMEAYKCSTGGKSANQRYLSEQNCQAHLLFEMPTPLCEIETWLSGWSSRNT